MGHDEDRILIIFLRQKYCLYLVFIFVWTRIIQLIFFSVDSSLAFSVAPSPSYSVCAPPPPVPVTSSLHPTGILSSLLMSSYFLPNLIAHAPLHSVRHSTLTSSSLSVTKGRE